MTQSLTSVPDAGLERRAMRKVMWRLLPLMALMFLTNQVDRANISFAALTMNRDLGLDNLTYAWGAGIFFISYFACEVPSNLLQVRYGARRWIGRIMISWGIVSGATAFVSGPAGFLTARFLLGAAEAGFVPGMLLYINQWFPPSYRARATAILFISAPMGNAVSGLLSVPLLRLNRLAGLSGWQWMFVIEALPALILGFYAIFRLADWPRDVSWLSPDESRWLERRIEPGWGHESWRRQIAALFDRKVILMSLIYFFRTASMYGFSLFLPLILKGMGYSNVEVGYLATGPFAIAALGAVIWGVHSDRRDERHWHTALAMVLAAAGLAAAAMMGASIYSFAAVSAAAVGLYAQAVSFWSLPSLLLRRQTVPATVAAINAVGNLGGFMGPYLVGATARGGNDFSSGLLLMAGCAALSALLSLVMMRLKWPVPSEGSRA